MNFFVAIDFIIEGKLNLIYSIEDIIACIYIISIFYIKFWTIVDTD